MYIYLFFSPAAFYPAFPARLFSFAHDCFVVFICSVRFICSQEYILVSLGDGSRVGLFIGAAAVSDGLKDCPRAGGREGGRLGDGVEMEEVWRETVEIVKNISCFFKGFSSM